jgi:hypothetical protein
MNFDKDYIDLCKNPKVQGLRKELEKEDFIISECELIRRINPDYIIKRNDFTWLPTGDQLDQHIIEQLDDGSDYTFIYTNFSKEAGHYNAIVYEGGEVKEQIIYEENPLICKLKLLISLLKEE